jgi:hypothetical protein
MYVAKFNNKSGVKYLAALGYIENRGMQNVCPGIFYSVTYSRAESHLTVNVL